MDPVLARSIAVLTALFAVGAVVMTVRVRAINRELRDFAYLRQSDPAAYHALAEVHAPRLAMYRAWLIAMPLILGLFAWVVIADWRAFATEADRLDRAPRSEPGHRVEREDLFDGRRYAVLDGGRLLRVYYHAPRDECVLSRVDVLQADDMVRITAYGGVPAGAPVRSCSAAFTAEPNRYFDARLDAALGGRRVEGAGTAVKRHWLPWLNP